jgi:hypothetical protein
MPPNAPREEAVRLCAARGTIGTEAVRIPRDEPGLNDYGYLELGAGCACVASVAAACSGDPVALSASTIA